MWGASFQTLPWAPKVLLAALQVSLCIEGLHVKDSTNRRSCCCSTCIPVQMLLDFSKTFDTVAHNKLLLKLAHYGIQSNNYISMDSHMVYYLNPKSYSRRREI